MEQELLKKAVEILENQKRPEKIHIKRNTTQYMQKSFKHFYYFHSGHIFSPHKVKILH